MKKIHLNPDYTSWDLHFFTDDDGPEIVNDEPDSTDSDVMEDYEAESFMSHRVINAIIAFDVIPNVLKSKWTDVRGTPPIKTYNTSTGTSSVCTGVSDFSSAYSESNESDYGSAYSREEI